MEFVFTCLETNQVFTTDRFEVTENHGVKADAAGNKILDAKVALTDPCPFCGGKHVYRASELACPFSG